MPKARLRRLSACAVSGSYALLMFLASSAATRASAQTASPPASRGKGGLEEIVVTARKRAENVQNIPVAITALSARQLQRYELTSLEKVSSITPEFSVGRASNGSGAILTLRGIGSDSTSIGIEQSVAVVVDGVYYGQGRVIQEGLFDLSQLEILKGPQALFYGKNATAGVISMTTADPTDQREVMVRTGFETGSEQLVGEALVSGKLADGLDGRLAFRGTDMFGGYFTNDGKAANYSTFDVATGSVSNHLALPAARDEPGENELMPRGTLKWKPTDDFTATLKASYDRDRSNNNSWNYAAYDCLGGHSQLNPQNACGHKFVIDQDNIPADIAATMPFANHDGALGDDYRSYAVTLRLNYVLPEVNVTSVTNYNNNENSFTCDCALESADSATFATERSTFHAFSTEERALTTFEFPVNLLGGIYYQSTNRVYDQDIAFAGVSNSAAPAEDTYVALQKHSTTDGETVSLFSQVIGNIGRQIEITGGARYTYETKDSLFVQPYVNPAVTALFIPDKPISADQVFHNVSPEATITYKPRTNVTLYAAYKTGYKSGGFSGSGIFGAQSTVHDFAFSPETARGAEGGVRSTLLDNQLRVDLTGYYYRFSNLQVDFFNSPTFAFITKNAGGALTKGVEFNTTYAPRAVDGLTVHGTLNYNDAYYTSFIAPCWAGQTIRQGCNLIGAAPEFTPDQSLAGHATANAPKWTAVLGMNKDTQIDEHLEFGISLDARFDSSYIPSSFGEPYSRQSAYVNFDASLRLKTVDDRWELALIGRNLTNNFVVTGVEDGPNTGIGTGQAVGAHADQIGYADLPRTVLIQLTWRE